MCKEQKEIKAAIMGGYGTFHEIAALHYFKDVEVEIIPSESFDDLFRLMKQGAAQHAISAIENSVAGSILPNYNLINNSDLQITGEIYLRVCQNLVALSGQTIDDLHEVYSHPMAILQSKPFFDKYPHIKLIDGRDTASCMRDISVNGLKGVGAIGSRYAAEKFDLEILSASIETNKKNYTRFLILTDKEYLPSNKSYNKSSISFALADEIGSLSKVLSIFSYFNINLSKIQSLPIIGKEWEYLFYVDLEFSNEEIYRQSLVSVAPFISNLNIMGEYCKGKVISE
ncbi:MAG: prephenate dehydratase [Bacteroidales bacterium]|jgi:prephenate dehydratase|nr:prephenate dehydratase [Bacteroidales bacterium]